MLRALEGSPVGNTDLWIKVSPRVAYWGGKPEPEARRWGERLNWEKMDTHYTILIAPKEFSLGQR